MLLQMHAVTVVAEQPRVVEQLGPPVRHLGGAGEGVTDQHHVVAGRVELAVDRIAQVTGRSTPPHSRAKPSFSAKECVPWIKCKALVLICGSFLRRWPRLAAACPADRPVAVLSAWFRSAMMSRMSSMPTESRTSSGVTPVSTCSASLSCWCVVEAGWMTSDLASPMLASRLNSLSELMSLRPAS